MATVQDAKTDLGRVLAEAREARLAFEAGETTPLEYIERLERLRQPRGFWAKVSWSAFGI